MEQTLNKTTKTDIFKIDPRKIVVVEGFNSRVDFGNIDELAEQIREQGVLNPITVIKSVDKDTKEDTYRLVDGERRYRATMKLINEGHDIARIPALFVSDKLTQEELLTQQVLRNEGKPFNEYEFAIVCSKFVKWGHTNSDIARKLGKNPGCVKYYLDHLNRDERVQELLKTNRISGAQVRRVYKAHQQADGSLDETGAVNELLGLKAISEEKGNKKLHLSDIEVGTSRTRASKDTAIIRKALSLLINDYYMKYTNNGEVKLKFNVREIEKRLRENKNLLITDIFEQALSEYKAAE